jgi:hypothetical protein
MIKPKEKAKELVEKMNNMPITIEEWNKASDYAKSDLKRKALIVVEEILNARPLDPNHVDWDDCGAAHQYWYEAQKEEALEFWQEVKQEIRDL